MIRRLSEEISRQYPITVDLILYGTEPKIFKHSEKIHSRYYTDLQKALSGIGDYDHVIFVYLPITDIWACRQHCRNLYSRTRFHNLFQVWPESILKRELLLRVNFLMPVNGQNIAVSPRLSDTILKRRGNCCLLYPPVPRDYFITPDKKRTTDKVRVTFIGRIDIGKGILDTLELFDRLSKNENIELKLYGIHWESDPIAVDIHNTLLRQNKFFYQPVNFSEYSKDIDNMVRSALSETDIFIQPYRQLSSTIDSPLLVLEAMASLCAVITKPFGNIPLIYGDSPCLYEGDDYIPKMTELILTSDTWLEKERQRIYHQNTLLKFDIGTVAEQFMAILK